jgi:hypothetical protein
LATGAFGGSAVATAETSEIPTAIDTRRARMPLSFAKRLNHALKAVTDF